MKNIPKYITNYNGFPPFFRPYEIMSNDMKKAFTNCIPCMKLKVPTNTDGFENKAGENIKTSQENVLMEKENRRQRQMHTIPSSLIEVTKGQ